MSGGAGGRGPSRRAKVHAGWLRTLLLCLLMQALAVNGQAGVLAAAVGPLHHHADPVRVSAHRPAVAASTSPQATCKTPGARRDAGLPVDADARLPAGRGLSSQSLPAGHAVRSDGLRGAWATLRQWHERAGAARTALDAAAPAHPHTHGHGLFERHHHDVGDASVLALDSPTTASAAELNGGAGGHGAAVSLPTLLASSLSVAEPAACPAPWPMRADAAWCSADLAHADRPPNA